MNKEAAADLTPVRQRTQYTCMATSLMMCLNAHGRDFDEDTVNKVMGAQPMQGASWEAAMNAAQHFGFRINMIVPATIKILKDWTDQGIPVMIAWNPEGRPWSHASVVFDVKEDGTVYIADPNIPDPDETVRIVSKDDFYHKWFEKAPDYLVRRTAMAIMPEITSDGRQVVASQKKMSARSNLQVNYVGGNFYRVIKPFQVWLKVGFAWTNASYGSSRIGRNVYKAVTLHPGDEVQYYSEAFAVIKGKPYRVVPELDSHGEFEHAGVSYERWPLDNLQAITKEEATDFSGMPDDRKEIPSANLTRYKGTGDYITKTATPKHPNPATHLTAVVGRVERVRRLGDGGSLGPNPHGIWAVKIGGVEYVVEGPIPRDIHVGVTVDFWAGKTPDPVYQMPSAHDLLIAQEDSKVAKAPQPVNHKKKDDGHTVHVKMPHPRDDVARAIAEKGGVGGTGAHHNREKDFEQGKSRKPKHKVDWRDKDACDHLADRYMEKENGR